MGDQEQIRSGGVEPRRSPERRGDNRTSFSRPAESLAGRRQPTDRTGDGRSHSNRDFGESGQSRRRRQPRPRRPHPAKPQGRPERAEQPQEARRPRHVQPTADPVEGRATRQSGHLPPVRPAEAPASIEGRGERADRNPRRERERRRPARPRLETVDHLQRENLRLEAQIADEIDRLSEIRLDLSPFVAKSGEI